MIQPDIYKETKKWLERSYAPCCSGNVGIKVEHGADANEIMIKIYSDLPGALIGYHGDNIKRFKEDLEERLNKDIKSEEFIAAYGKEKSERYIKKVTLEIIEIDGFVHKKLIKDN